MNELSPSETQYSKMQPPAQETQKRKKSSKKKAEPKPTNPRSDPIEGVIPDLNTEVDFDLVHYTYKLEQQVSAVKKQLKLQKKKFRHIIHGLSKYFDEKGVSSQVVEEFIKSLGTQVADNQDRESEYEKFFTVHKYQLVEDPATFAAKFMPKSGHRNEHGGKHSHNTSARQDSADHSNQIDLSNDKAEKPEKTDKPEKKKAKPSTKGTATSNGTSTNVNGDEAPKKRKYTKRKQSEEGLLNLASDIQEIPPFSPAKEFPKKMENKVKKAEDTIRGYEDINSKHVDLNHMFPQPNIGGLDDGLKALVKQMNIDPSVLINPYMPTKGNFGITEGDFYNKFFQELMKVNPPNSMFNTDKNRQELFNYYPTNFK